MYTIGYFWLKMESEKSAPGEMVVFGPRTDWNSRRERDGVVVCRIARIGGECVVWKKCAVYMF